MKNNYWVGPKISFGIFRKMLRKNPNELWGQPNIIFKTKTVRRMVLCNISATIFKIWLNSNILIFASTVKQL